MTRFQDALPKHANYFYTVISDAKNSTKSASTYSKIDDEWENILLAFNFLKSKLHNDSSFAVLCNNYVSEMGFYLKIRRHPLEYLSWLQVATEAARILGEPEVETNHLGNIGNCYFQMGNFDQAITTYENCLRGYQKAGNSLGEARTLIGVGSIHAATGDLSKAIKYFEESLAIAEIARETPLIANALLNLGGALNDKNNPKQALPTLEKATELLIDNNNILGTIQALNNLATSYILLNKPKEAIRSLTMALEKAKDLDAKRETAHILGNLGIILANLQKLDEAIQFLRESLEISTLIGESHLSQITQQNLSILIKRKKQATP
jgi:tetratricopeptide (TPR) repeat protein